MIIAYSRERTEGKKGKNRKMKSMPIYRVTRKLTRGE